MDAPALTDDPRQILAGVPDPEAQRMLTAIWEIIQTWDDLIDQDKPVPPEAIHRAFLAALELPANPFYSRFMGQFLPLLQLGFIRWIAANVYERELRSLDKAYMLRATYYDLVAMVYYCLQGPAQVETYAPSVYDRYGETLESLKAEVEL